MKNRKPIRMMLYSIFVCGLLFLFKVSPAHTENSLPREHVVKSGMILKFTEFIRWPKQKRLHINTNDFVICSIGDDPFGNLFFLARKEGLIEKNLVVKKRVSYDEMNSCHIVFVSKSEEDNLDEILMTTQDKPILLMGDTDGFAKRGVGVNFIILNNRIRFEINRDAVERSGIKISSELLNLAIIVN